MAEWKLPERFAVGDRYVRFGIHGAGPPVIVVHGTPWSSYNMRHIIDALCADFTVYLFDLNGYGQSDKSAGRVSLDIQNTILDQLIDHWGLEKPAIVGHDFGGVTVLRTHLINQRDFARIVLIDPVSISPWGPPLFQHVKAHEAAFAGVPDCIHETIVRAYISTAAVKPIDEETMQRTVEPWISEGGKAAFYRQIAHASEDYTDEVQPSYGLIRSPVMILWGNDDTWIPVERGKLLHETIPGSRFQKTPDAGHLVIEEQPELLMQAIHPFLSCGSSGVM